MFHKSTVFYSHFCRMREKNGKIQHYLSKITHTISTPQQRNENRLHEKVIKNQLNSLLQTHEKSWTSIVPIMRNSFRRLLTECSVNRNPMTFQTSCTRSDEVIYRKFKIHFELNASLNTSATSCFWIYSTPGRNQFKVNLLKFQNS